MYLRCGRAHFFMRHVIVIVIVAAGFALQYSSRDESATTGVESRHTSLPTTAQWASSSSQLCSY